MSFLSRAIASDSPQTTSTELPNTRLDCRPPWKKLLTATHSGGLPDCALDSRADESRSHEGDSWDKWSGLATTLRETAANLAISAQRLLSGSDELRAAASDLPLSVRHLDEVSIGGVEEHPYACPEPNAVVIG